MTAQIAVPANIAGSSSTPNIAASIAAVVAPSPAPTASGKIAAEVPVPTLHQMLKMHEDLVPRKSVPSNSVTRSKPKAILTVGCLKRSRIELELDFVSMCHILSFN